MTTNTGHIFETLFEHSADGIVISDEAGLVVRCNPAFAKLLTKKAEDIAGRSLHEFLDLSCHGENDSNNPAPQPMSIAKMLEGGESKNGNSDSKNIVVFCANGLDLIMPASHFTTENSAGKQFVTMVYIVQAQSVQQAQTEFVSTVSHELRTPLTSIKGFADTILRAGDRIDAASQRRYIGIIKDQADRLTRLVEDLLAVSRLESRRMQLTIRAINLEEAVQRVVQNLSEKAKRHQIAVKIPPGLPQVWADADRLEQILTNLIDNAIKYSPAETTVTICARAIHQEPEMVEFSVTDQGGGISADYLPQIFNKFSRQDNPLTRQTEGTGLGLYITKSLVIALDGNINVTSEPGSTTFTVQVPSATLEQQAARGRGYTVC
ncbi:MAG: PAS domain-containing protein [Candidatus Obscuribacterales bacterium]|nr:PAS domain-containing protein [Candidatus Obscuribacterales bacterium]